MPPRRARREEERPRPLGVASRVFPWESRKAISERTKAALAAARSRGVRLGNPRLRPGTAASAATARKARTVRTEERALELREVINDAERQGHRTLRQLARYLNDLGISSALGRAWHANRVRRVRQIIASS